ncbi:MAG: tail fiber domain-containing protein [Bacteroidia bacterium]|nr:tail fiber domain-containing protein [Bacteroidia bacterium]
MKHLFILFAGLFLSGMVSAQNVGIDQPSPVNKLDISGNLSVGEAYSGTFAAPANGAIFQGFVGIGTNAPSNLLSIEGSQGAFFVHPYFPPFNKTVLVASFGGETAGPQIRFEGPGNSFIDIGNDSSNNFVLETSDNVRLQVNQDGLIGMGTTTPLSDLHIRQSNSLFPNPSTGGLRLDNGSSSWQIWHSNNFLSFGFQNVRVAYIENSSGAYVTTSDFRLKRNIEPMSNTLDRVMALRPVSFHYVHQTADEPKVQGFIAQEVEPLFPEAVHQDENGDMRGISYSDFGVIAIKAIQEQQEIIDAQQAVIEDLVKRLEALEQSTGDK